MEKNKNIVSVWSLLLVVGFFMPWVKVFISFSAYDLVFGDIGELSDNAFRYFAVLVPLAGAYLIYGLNFDGGRFLFSRRLLQTLPLIVLIAFCIAILVKIEGMGALRSSDENLQGLAKFFQFGFWLSIISAFGLALVGTGEKTELITKKDE